MFGKVVRREGNKCSPSMKTAPASPHSSHSLRCFPPLAFAVPLFRPPRQAQTTGSGAPRLLRSAPAFPVTIPTGPATPHFLRICAIIRPCPPASIWSTCGAARAEASSGLTGASPAQHAPGSALIHITSVYTELKGGKWRHVSPGGYRNLTSTHPSVFLDGISCFCAVDPSIDPKAARARVRKDYAGGTGFWLSCHRVPKVVNGEYDYSDTCGMNGTLRPSHMLHWDSLGAVQLKFWNGVQRSVTKDNVPPHAIMLPIRGVHLPYTLVSLADL